MEDSPLAYDFVTSRLHPRHVVAVGISLGSGVASALAARRRLDGLILVTPFDSLRATAIQDHPWLPVSSLFRHDIPSAELLRGTRQPVAILASGRDRLVRAERTQALREAVPNLVYDSTIPRARHHDIFFQPEFAPAMRVALARIERARPPGLTSAFHSCSIRTKHVHAHLALNGRRGLNNGSCGHGGIA